MQFHAFPSVCLPIVRFAVIMVAVIMGDMSELPAQWFYPSGYYGKGATEWGDYQRGAASIWHGQGAYQVGAGAYLHGLADYRRSVYEGYAAVNGQPNHGTAVADQKQQGQAPWRQPQEAAMRDRDGLQATTEVAEVKRQLQDLEGKLESTERKLTLLLEQFENRPQAILAADAEELRRNAREANLSRFRDHIQSADLLAGSTINFLIQEQGSHLPALLQDLADLPLDPEAIHFETAITSELTDQMKHLNRSQTVRWPLALQGLAYAEHCRQIDEHIHFVCERLTSHLVLHSDCLPIIRKEIHQLNQLNMGMCPPLSERRQAREFLSELTKLTRLLEHPDARKLFDGTLQARVETVGEFVQHMVANNLRLGSTSERGFTTYYQIHLALAKIHRQQESSLAMNP